MFSLYILKPPSCTSGKLRYTLKRNIYGLYTGNSKNVDTKRRALIKQQAWSSDKYVPGVATQSILGQKPVTTSEHLVVPENTKIKVCACIGLGLYMELRCLSKPVECFSFLTYVLLHVPRPVYETSGPSGHAVTLMQLVQVGRSVCELQRLRERHPKAGTPPATAMGTPSKIAGRHFQGWRRAQAL